MFPPFRRVAFGLSCLVFLGLVLLGDNVWLPMTLALDAPGLSQGVRWWAVFTAAWVPGRELAGQYPDFLVTLVLMWSMGSRLEDFWGSRRFALFCFTVAVGAYASLGLWALIVPQWLPNVVGGPLPVNLAVSTAFAIVFRRTQFTPIGESRMSGGFIGLFLAALLVFSAVFSGPAGDWGGAALLPGTLLICAAFLFQPWRKGSGIGSGRHTSAAERVEKAKHLRLVN